MKKIFFIFFCLVLFVSSCESRSSKNLNFNINRTTSDDYLKVTKLYSIEGKSNKKGIKILSWNIQDLGGSKNTQEINQIARIIRDYDIVAIQEVVAKDPKGAQAVAKIADELNRMGSKWDYSISNPTKSPSSYMSERYAFIWKTSKLKLLQRPFLDAELENEIIREPFIGKFQAKNADSSFYLINIHARVYNQNPENEIIHFKDYPKRLNTQNIIILGDFNLNEKHDVWNNLFKIGFKPSIENAPTTLKRTCNKTEYLNHNIDNIYYYSKRIKPLNSGRLDFVNSCQNLEKARSISDHLPVFLEFVLE